jgi:hypothetical protein
VTAYGGLSAPLCLNGETMKILSLTWLIVQNLIAISIAFFIFKISSSHFQTAILSFMLLIYIQITGSGSFLTYFMIDRSQKRDKQFIHILQALKDPLPDDPDIQKQLKEDEAFYNEINYKYVIGNICRFIILLIALWHLLSILI